MDVGFFAGRKDDFDDTKTDHQCQKLDGVCDSIAKVTGCTITKRGGFEVPWQNSLE